jgi:hypothetical protein
MRRTLILLLWILIVPLSAPAQAVRIASDNENFRATPDGVILGTLRAGVDLQPGEERDAWREITLEGWVWAPSVRADSRPGFDLVVRAQGGENLRAAPNGDRIARLVNGALLVEVEREGQWIRVQRVAWVRAAALSGGSPALHAPPPAAVTPAAETARGAGAPPATTAGATDTKAASASAAPSPAAPRPAPPELAAGSIAWTGQAGTRLLNAPAGDTLASLRPMTAIEVLDRQGEWARVRLEGWVWASTLGTPADTGAVISGLALEVLLSNPEGFRDRILEWQVQFIALDRAEKIRADFAEGELFILARPPGDQPGFVYIAVPEAQASRARALTPLQRITILARVRTGRSAQMAAPILDLLEIR